MKKFEKIVINIIFFNKNDTWFNIFFKNSKQGFDR